MSITLIAATLARAGGGAGAASHRPFIDPVQVGPYWWLLLLPLSFGVAVVYKAVRAQTMRGYWRQVLLMTLQIVVGMVLLAVASYLMVEVYAGWIARRAA